MNTLFLIVVWGDVDPDILGPFETEEERDKSAGKFRFEEGDENGVYKLSIAKNGIPSIYPYSGEEMQDLMAIAEQEALASTNNKE